MKKVYWYEVGQSRYKKALDSPLQKKDIYVSGSVFSEPTVLRRYYQDL